MSIPALKRVTIRTRQELENWVKKHPELDGSVMLVTRNEASGSKHVSREDLQDALALTGWQCGRRYTLNAAMIGQVIHREVV